MVLECLYAALGYHRALTKAAQEEWTEQHDLPAIMGLDGRVKRLYGQELKLRALTQHAPQAPRYLLESLAQECQPSTGAALDYLTLRLPHETVLFTEARTHKRALETRVQIITPDNQTRHDAFYRLTQVLYLIAETQADQLDHFSLPRPISTATHNDRHKELLVKLVLGRLTDYRCNEVAANIEQCKECEPTIRHYDEVFGTSALDRVFPQAVTSRQA